MITRLGKVMPPTLSNSSNKLVHKIIYQAKIKEGMERKRKNKLRCGSPSRIRCMLSALKGKASSKTILHEEQGTKGKERKNSLSQMQTCRRTISPGLFSKATFHPQ